MGYIYKITNDVNGKVYIGKTEESVGARWAGHLQAARKEDGTEKRPLYDAFRKYGIQHFHIEQIEETNNTQEREQYWINYYRSYVGFPDCNGYNATLGGDGKSYFNHTDEEVIQKYKELKTVRATAKYFQCDEWTISVRLHRNNIDINATQRALYSYPVVGTDVLTGEKICFKTKVEAARWLIEHNKASGNVNSTSANIGRCCSGKRHTCAGYTWKVDKED